MFSLSFICLPLLLVTILIKLIKDELDLRRCLIVFFCQLREMCIRIFNFSTSSEFIMLIWLINEGERHAKCCKLEWHSVERLRLPKTKRP